MCRKWQGHYCGMWHNADQDGQNEAKATGELLYRLSVLYMHRATPSSGGTLMQVDLTSPPFKATGDGPDGVWQIARVRSNCRCSKFYPARTEPVMGRKSVMPNARPTGKMTRGMLHSASHY